ncbi:hypothetical protein MA16_Dca017206 [Dendrobium catenatum]|uniref:Uncharacterized protein n=1 Tax=Dendrobium catenatum TaxID=906689 RepID=A0A2I0W2P5_9ASPA|nr:hypothetical protein MA16_Dca017206 [Dendrobium catenatum]
MAWVEGDQPVDKEGLQVYFHLHEFGVAVAVAGAAVVAAAAVEAAYKAVWNSQEFAGKELDQNKLAGNSEEVVVVVVVAAAAKAA